MKASLAIKGHCDVIPICLVGYFYTNNDWDKTLAVVNPRRACAARVTVLRLSVCLSVCLLQLA